MSTNETPDIVSNKKEVIASHKDAQVIWNLFKFTNAGKNVESRARLESIC